MSSWFYILRLKSGGLYPGVTTNLASRLRAHFNSNACRTTRLDPPISLIYSEGFDTLGQAQKRENQNKRWSRAKKEALIDGNINMLRDLAKRRNR